MDSSLDDILLEIRMQLLNIGEHAYVDMIEMMKDFGRGDRLSKIELMNALTKSGIFLSLVQLSTLVRGFDLDGTGQLSISAYGNAVKGVLSERRKTILSQVFSKLDSNGKGKVEYKMIMSKFNPEGHPSVRAALLSAEAVMDRMITVFSGAEKKGFLTFDDFLDFYSRMSATIPHNDNLFAEIMNGVWNCSESLEKKHIDKDDPKVATMLNIMREKVRQKSSMHCGNFNTTLYKLFKFFDFNKKETINFKEWTQSLERLGVVVGKGTSKDIFNCFAKEGELEYKEFSQWLFNDVKERDSTRRMIS